MLVTTSYNASESMELEAQALAEAVQGRFVPRGRSSLTRLRTKYSEEHLLLLDRDGTWKYYETGDIPLFFHPSTALLRVKKLLRGEKDPLLEASKVCHGDVVLDCTAGLGSDAIVFAYAVGPYGHITAIESEDILYRIVSMGLQAYTSNIPELDEAMRRVKLEKANHMDYLSALPDRSVDLIYFDPMFRHPIEHSASISPLRTVANLEAITQNTIQEARRVARKRIVLKEHTHSPEFARLGFEWVHRSYSKIAYGVIEC
jgi:16S rRNA (guanine1516-N2)-methyltransferase